MPNTLDDIFKIIGLIGTLIGSLWSIIKLSEWWGNKGKEREERIDLELEWIEDFMEENKDVLSEETMGCLEDLAYPMMEEMFDSRNKGEDSWYEIGKTNPEYRRTNGFQVTVSGNNQNIFI